MATASYVGGQDDLYQQAASEFGPAVARLARGYEADADKRRDLLQEIHLSLWRSFEGFNQSCSLRTWVYRMAHNAAPSYVIRQRRARPQTLVGLDEVDALLNPPGTDRKMALSRLTDLSEAAVFAAVVWLNMRAARRLDRRIAELDREAGVV